MGCLRLRLVRERWLFHLLPSAYLMTEPEGRAVCLALGPWTLELTCA